MKVAFVSYGFHEVCVRIASALSGQAEVFLALPRRRAEPHYWQLDPTVHLYAFDHPRLRQPLRQLRCARSLVAHIREFDPDVVHLQQGHTWFNLFLPALRRYPLVITIHDPRPHVGDGTGKKMPDLSARSATGARRG